MSMLGHYTLLFHRRGLTKTTSLEGKQHSLAHPDEPFVWPYEVEKTSDSLRGCIHVGAWDCAEMGCYVALFNKNVIWIEANPFTCENLSRPRTRLYDHGLFNFAAYDKDDEEVELRIPHKADCSTLMISSQPDFQPIDVVKVKTKKLDTLIKEQQIDMNNIDFLNIDTEGCEYKVLEGMKENLKYIDFIFLEVANDPERFPGTPRFNEIEQYLRDRGFILVEHSDMAQGWGDAFFVRESKL